MKKILVIEDSAPVRLNTIKILQYEGFNVLGAENGAIGVQLAKEEKPDLILCDIMMPVLDGYDVQNELNQKSETKTIPLIFLTAKAERSDMRLAMNLGADDYLTKPFSRDELLETVFSRLDKQTQIQEKYQHKLEQIRGNITGSLPAELFIPLQRIRSFLEALQQSGSPLSQVMQEALQNSLDSTAQLDKLLQNFLLYALLEIASHDPEQADAFRGQCVTESASVLTDIAQLKAHEFHRTSDLQLRLNEGQIPVLEANFAKIAEELLDNAFKFSEAGHEIRVESFIDSGKLKLIVADRGCGFPLEGWNAIDSSSRFQQNGNSRTGLGLAIAKRLTELHGGTLSLVKDPHETIVQVELPLAG